MVNVYGKFGRISGPVLGRLRAHAERLEQASTLLLDVAAGTDV